MKKKLSRLLCALLVMTMVLAMVPAVSAAEPKGTEDDPIIMYVGDYTSDYVSKAYGCNNSKHYNRSLNILRFSMAGKRN